METVSTETMHSALERVAPGTPLREGLDQILSARTGALIVIGDEKRVIDICNGGFSIQSRFTPQRVFELAKMDGAIITDAACETLLRANVHLVPDPVLPTTETGMRHQAAERVSRQTDALVVSVSAKRDIVSLYLRGDKVTLGRVEVVLAKADQALATLQRYRLRLDEVSSRLLALEFEDLVTMNEVAGVVQRFEMLQRVSREVGRYIVELGEDGRLVRMQAEELTLGVDEEYAMLLRDYMPDGGPRRLGTVRARIAALPQERLLESGAIAAALGFSTSSKVMEEHVHPRGYRLLRRIPMLPTTVISRIVERFGSMAAIVVATEEQLDDVDGVGTRRARAIAEGVRRIRRESTL